MWKELRCAEIYCFHNVISDVHVSCTHNASINYSLSKFIQHEIFLAFPSVLNFLLSHCRRHHHPCESLFIINYSLFYLSASPVQYKITNGNEEGIFRIHNTTGQIFIAAELDYEKVKKVSSYFMLPRALIDHNNIFYFF